MWVVVKKNFLKWGKWTSMQHLGPTCFVAVCRNSHFIKIFRKSDHMGVDEYLKWCCRKERKLLPIFFFIKKSIPHWLIYSHFDLCQRPWKPLWAPPLHRCPKWEKKKETEKTELNLDFVYWIMKGIWMNELWSFRNICKYQQIRF